MKMIKLIRYFLIIIIFCAFLTKTDVIYATSISGEIQGFKAEVTTETSVTGLQTVVQKILNALRVASALLLIVVVATSGIRYITSPANIKGEIKKTALPIILGLIFIFGASNFAAYLIQVFGK